MVPIAEPDARRLLLALFRAAVDAAHPAHVLAAHLPEKPRGRCIIVGAGKASAAMAAAVDAAWPDVDLSGVVVTRDGHAVPAGRIEILEAAHPVPDARSEAAARRMLSAVAGLGPEDLVLALVSGGGSALLALPADGVTLAQKQAITRRLLASGATIGEMNIVRRRLSAIKGGRLAAAAVPARVVTLVVSDVPGDDPALIASGPTVPDATDPDRIREIAERYDITLPAGLDLTSAPPAAVAADVRMIASPAMALTAAARVARDAGVMPLILGDAIEGEAREVARAMSGIARSARSHGHPAPAPLVLLSGGEATVTIPPDVVPGRGGRNTAFLLSLALALGGADGIYALAGDTDGIDGTEDAAGAIVTPDTLARARALGLSPAAVERTFDSYGLFSALGDLVVTGPTFTNVNDFRALLIL